MRILGIETSCDETSVALIDDGHLIIANAVFTQSIHSEYGGVVPEIASRAHIQKIDLLCQATLSQYDTQPTDLSLIAVTDRPGLAGALLVGISFASGLHCGYSIPIIGVNHLEGHINSIMLENQSIEFPFIALVVSGGHTALYRVDDYGRYQSLGHTIDDAAGEAFDKIGKLLGFPYPAGRQIEECAAQYTSNETIHFPIARLSSKGIDFSFSGLKTAVKYYLAGKTDEFIQSNKPMICHGFQNAVIESLVQNTKAAVHFTGINRIALVGGVACNKALRNRLRDRLGEEVYFPSLKLCTDNAAMIAKAGYENFIRGRTRFPRMEPGGGL
jgi:N6-L-threonylcarbamoyladenine synthase